MLDSAGYLRQKPDSTQIQTVFTYLRNYFRGIYRIIMHISFA